MVGADGAASVDRQFGWAVRFGVITNTGWHYGDRRRTLVPPRFLYDGDCAFCDRSVAWLRRSGVKVDFVTYQSAVDYAARQGLDAEDLRSAAYFIPDRGSPVRGHLAIAGVLATSKGRGSRFLGSAIGTPPFSIVAARVYKLVARNRHRLSRSATCSLPPIES